MYVPAARFFFIPFILITNLALMNLVTGVIVDKVVSNAKQTELDTELEVTDPKEEVELLAHAFEQAQNEDGRLDAQALQNGLAKGSAMEEALRKLNVFLGSNTDMLFNVLDANDNGAVSLPEFVDGISRMKGSTQSKHMFFVHSDLHTISKKVYSAVATGSNTMSNHLESVEHMENLVRDLWLMTQKQATNRWSSDPFHSSLHQMVGNIHELVAEMAKKQLPQYTPRSHRVPNEEVLSPTPRPPADLPMGFCGGACTPVPAVSVGSMLDADIARVPDSKVLDQAAREGQS
jgi:hypothetical protein